MAALQEAVSARDFEQARRHALSALDHVPGFVDEVLLEYRTFDIKTIPPLEIGGLVFALLDDTAGIERIKSVAVSRAQLGNWHDVHTEHEESRVLFRAIERVVAAKPGVLQAGMKNEVDAPDGRRVSTLIGWLEKAGRIRREPVGKTYALFLPTVPGISPAPPVRECPAVGSDRRNGSPKKLMVDWSAVAQIALPRSPSRWDLDPGDRRQDALADLFEIVDSQQWGVLGVESLPSDERPDPAFRKLYATSRGILALDDLGKSNHGGQPAAVCYARGGEITASESLRHGVYRIGVSAMSGSFIALSRNQVAHAYDDHLRVILETDLANAPEVIALQRRLGVSAAELHTHIRSIALSDDASRYLFTVVDEAWCVGLDGIGIWGLGVPLQDGYRLHGGDAVGTRDDVQHALDTLGLSLPLVADDVKQRYRSLARTWHPDVNRSPDAGVRMQEINLAASLLTGLDEGSLSRYAGLRTAYKDMGSLVMGAKGTGVTMSFGMSMGEKNAADWIYASAFAASVGRSFMATYSGKVLEVDDSGAPVRYYSIGSVPERIIDTGDRLYLLTATRLYVLRNGVLLALVDISAGGDVIAAQTGFGLLEKKRFRWFDEGGAHVATVLSKPPIRRVYQTSDAVIVETRTHRLRVGGARSWWR